MIIRRLCAIAAAFCAAILLSGCYVASESAPAGGALDDRLAGIWITVPDKDSDSKPGYMHFVRGKDGKPPRLVMANIEGVAILELHTLRLGDKGGAFATKAIFSDNEKDWDWPGYLLGLYELRRERLFIRLLDEEKLVPLVDQGRLKGRKTDGKFFDVILTGTPDEVAAFLRSAEASTAARDDASLLARRMPGRR
jgi:hypothetical protein